MTFEEFESEWRRQVREYGGGVPQEAVDMAEQAWEIAFNAGAASRDAEIAELIGMREEVLHYQREFHRKNDEIAGLVEHLARILWYIDNYGEKMRHNEHQRFRNGKFDADASSAAVEFNEVMDAEIDSAKEALAKVRKP